MGLYAKYLTSKQYHATLNRIISVDLRWARIADDSKKFPNRKTLELGYINFITKELEEALDWLIASGSSQEQSLILIFLASRQMKNIWKTTTDNFIKISKSKIIQRLLLLDQFVTY